MRNNPRVAYRDCDHCRKWLYDEETGKVRTKRVGRTTETKFVDIPRGEIPTPCDDPNLGCAKGHYSNPKSMSARNQMCYQYIKEAEAVNWQGVSVDGVVRRNAAIVRDIEENADKSEHYKMLLKTVGLSGLMGGNNGRQ